MIVENKPGAAGMLATRDVISQPADGHTLLLCTHFESINTAVYRNPQFKLDRLAPISLIAKYYYGIAMTNALPVNDIDGFIAHAKANPGVISYGTLGAASAQEIFVRQLERLAGISMNRVPFRTGPQIMPDLIAGRVHIYVSPTLAVLPLHHSKELKVIGDHQPRAAGERQGHSRRSRNGRFRSCASAGSASAPARERRSRSSPS